MAWRRGSQVPSEPSGGLRGAAAGARATRRRLRGSVGQVHAHLRRHVLLLTLPE